MTQIHPLVVIGWLKICVLNMSDFVFSPVLILPIFFKHLPLYKKITTKDINKLSRVPIVVMVHNDLLTQ